MRRLLEWQLASVKAVRPETSRVKTFTLALPEWVAHQAGQHYDIRLTAEDGYQAERSYSIASEPERRNEIDLTVERIEDGEVSPYLHDIAVPGDTLEVRGPIGGYFVWQAHQLEPLLLVAGGSGIVPLMAMIRHRVAGRSMVPVRLLYSSRTFDDINYASELSRLVANDSSLGVLHTLTRSQPPGWRGYARRIDREMLREALEPLGSSSRTYLCGPTLLVESAARALLDLGLPPAQIRTERFGPTGT